MSLYIYGDTKHKGEIGSVMLWMKNLRKQIKNSQPQ